MESEARSTEQPVLKFGFAKTAPKKLRTTDILAPGDKVSGNDDDEVRILSTHAIEGEKIIGESAEKTEEKKYVIPLIARNEWRFSGAQPTTATSDAVSNGAATEEDSLKAEAVRSLLEDARRLNEKPPDPSADVGVPLILRNAVPDGYETDDRLDVSLRPDEAIEADYEAVPIDAYGMAMLRGMGWSEGTPIGLSNKRAVQLVEPKMRPKGLGLGADKRLLDRLKAGPSAENKKENSKELVLKKGACLRILSGANRDLYAKVESFDEDNARVIVRLAIGGKVATVSEYAIELVTDGEYEREGKCLNKSKYEKYKEKSESKMSHMKEEDVDGEDFFDDSKRQSKKRRHENDDSRNDRSSVNPARKYENDAATSRSKARNVAKSWLRNDLRVRIVDKNYRQGKFYKSKVVIIDVSSANSCTCKAEDGKVLDGRHVRQSMLETVIPRSANAYVMIVKGQFAGELGKILSRDSEKALARLQFVRYPERVLDVDFDDICEYAGETDVFEEY